ncbi:phosphoserine transaminase [Brevundimonas sp. S1H14]|uniref:phosphoserine transaminase n=1 Tax=Brevundimonas sp. S1H14 TaxID=3078084 RepID=UPI0039E9DC48
MTPKPAAKPARPWFSAGPTAKRPGWELANLPTNLMGRGIRAPEVVERFAHGLRLTREVLSPPDDYVMLYTPGSDTGAVEAALWCMLGERPVQVIAYENFGLTWLADVKTHLGLKPEALTAPWGELPDLSKVDPKKDVVFPWNGTTSGVRVPDGDWIADDREGLTICDATSAAFAMDLPWDRLDVTTFSFQKALGGEAGVGVMVLSPRAVARLDSYRPDRAVPKVLRIADKTGFDRTLADGVVMNTFSVLTIEDWIDALDWAKAEGGLPALIARTDANYAALAEWVERTDWIAFLPEQPEIRSTTSVCLKFVDPRVAALDEAGQKAFVKRFKALLEGEGAVYDMEPHRNAPPGLRLWCGCTVETADIVAATPWLEWAFQTAVSELAQSAHR